MKDWLVGNTFICLMVITNKPLKRDTASLIKLKGWIWARINDFVYNISVKWWDKRACLD